MNPLKPHETMNICIVGCGYIGSSLAAYLKNKGHTITVTTRKKERVKELSAYHVVLLDDWKQALANQEVIIVCVAPDDNDYQSTYLDTAKAIVKNSSAYILYTSSTSVYGDQEGNWVDESTPLKPSNEKTKILCETENTFLTASQDTCILRLGGIFGPGREIHKRLEKHPILSGTGEGFVNLVSRKAVVSAIDFALTHHLVGIYNVCEPCELRKKELYDKICKEHHLPPITWDSTKTSVHGGNKRVSCKKLKEAGFNFPQSLL